MKKYFYTGLVVMCAFVYTASYAANYVLWYSSVDEWEIRWGWSTIYASQLTSTINTWNALWKILIAPDNAYTYEDVHVSDTSLNWVWWYGRWVPSYGTDKLQFNTAQMNFLTDSRKQWVALHELGHALWLEHHDLWDNVMYFQTVSRTSLGKQDIADYRYIYGY